MRRRVVTARLRESMPADIKPLRVTSSVATATRHQLPDDAVPQALPLRRAAA
jgi:hypothetical protein